MARNPSVMWALCIRVNGGSTLRRTLHDGANTAKHLLNAENMVAADSLSRSRVKMSVADQEKNAQATKIEPSTDVLHQVPGGAAEATGDAEAERQDDYAAADPNSSMWNLCKSGKDTQSTAKKMTLKFKKMKDNVKQYYLDRIEENQVIFAEVNEPLRIGKLDKKDRLAKYKEMRDDDIAPLDEVQVLQRPQRSRKTSLFSRMQSNEEAEGEANQDTIYPEMKAESQVRGYKNFRKHEYRKSGQEFIERESDCRSVKYQCKSVGEESFRNERSYGDDRQMVPSMWKRPQIKDKDIKERCGEAGLADVLGTMSPATHFKQHSIPFKRLVDYVKSTDTPIGFCQRQLFGCRNYSTSMRRQFKSNFEVITNDNNFADWRSYSSGTTDKCKYLMGKQPPPPLSAKVTKRYASDDPCTPKGMPPKTCDPNEKLNKCPPEPYPWPPCPRITLCGCDPVSPRVLNATCFEWKGFLSMAKRPEYICPSFSECKYNTTMNRKKITECCGYKKRCDTFVGPLKRFVTAQERQELNLGQKYWSAQQQSCCSFHSSARRLTAAAEGECDKPEKDQLPCQRTVNIPGQRKKEKPKACACEKLCMPCCEPARDPPECFAQYKKAPCTKFKNPRPSFSECQKKFPFKHTMCECEVPTKPKCEAKTSKEKEC